MYFDSPDIARHYQSDKSLALAYLMTVGSKALVLLDINDKGEADAASLRNSFDAESEIKLKMVIDENQRQFQKLITEKPGFSVAKRARNGKWRQINLWIENWGLVGEIVRFVWPSKFVGKSYFSLTDCKVELLHESDKKVPQAYANSGLPIVRFSNNSRHLDVLFRTPDDTYSCLKFFEFSKILSGEDRKNP